MLRRMCWGPWSLGQNVADDHPRWHAEVGGVQGKDPGDSCCFYGLALVIIWEGSILLVWGGQDLGLSLDYKILLDS